jgi:hypothetical protein
MENIQWCVKMTLPPGAKVDPEVERVLARLTAAAESK